jgi:hypothetical protein
MADAPQLHVGPGLAESARCLKINVSAAAREGVEAAVRAAMVQVDGDAYRGRPERPDPLWPDHETWPDGACLRGGGLRAGLLREAHLPRR